MFRWSLCPTQELQSSQQFSSVLFPRPLGVVLQQSDFPGLILCSHPVFTDWPVFRPPLN